MVVSWHDEAFSLDKPILTKELMERVFKRFREQQTSKLNWGLEAQQFLDSQAPRGEFQPKKYEE